VLPAADDRRLEVRGVALVDGGARSECGVAEDVREATGVVDATASGSSASSACSAARFEGVALVVVLVLVLVLVLVAAAAAAVAGALATLEKNRFRQAADISIDWRAPEAQAR
jgi:hypothetical protein